MTSPFFSRTWYLVADLKPRLRSHADIHRHTYRGDVWYVLQDHATGQFHRFTPGAYQIIGMMDGQRPLQDIWEAACHQLGDDMPTQDEIIILVSKLFRANVLHSDVMPDVEQLSQQRQTLSRRKILQQLKSPLGIRIPLLDPEKFLQNSMQVSTILFNRAAAAVWIAVVCLGLVLAGVHWGALLNNLNDRILSLENILLIGLVYPFVKVLHELGHAYAVKRWGGEVHEMGIMLLVFFPVPYVDASAASAFRSKYQRMLVGGAGILVEAFIAAVAMIIWVLAEPGVVRAVAFNTMFISGVSTLLFNGNPLLRFDAYYVLADYLEIPNLANRSNQTIAYLIKRFAFRIDDLTSPFGSYREAAWMVIYSISAFIYRIFIMLVISLFIASKYYVVGVLLAVWSIYMTLLAPLIKTISKPFTDRQLQQNQGRVFSASISAVLIIALLVAIIPFPYATKAEGILWVPEQSFIRAGASGIATKLTAEPGSFVNKGDKLLEMHEPGLVARARVLAAQVEEAKSRYQSTLMDRVESTINLEVVRFREQEYRRAVERQEGLQISSQLPGIFVVPESMNLPGKFIRQGEMLGYVVDFEKMPGLVLIAEDSIDKVQHNSNSIEVRLVSDRNTSYPASILRILPASSHELPSDVLSTEGGGSIALDPKQGNNLLSFTKHFQLVLDIPTAPKNRINERIYVLFEHDPEPLVMRWYRGVRRVFLRQLNV